MDWTNAAVSLAVSMLVLVLGLAVIEALKRRGFDPVGRIASIADPRTTVPPAAQ